MGGYSALLIGTGDWYSTRCRLIWKLKGTKYNRMYFQLQVSTLPTKEIGSGLLPTVTTRADMREPQIENGKVVNKSGKGIYYGVTLDQLAKTNLLPTPRANKVNGCDLMSANLANRNKGNLEEVVAKALQSQMLPTPTADDNPAKNTGKRNQDGLQKRAYQMTGKTSQLSVQFVQEMMGFPENWLISPFQNGETKV